ncbi:hypothetical protein LCGC14_0799380 [marine sediment metagenome]|uniref:Uncharacterized protein n=1 Tax=marine sediment metagenome TaxID=412755 RepID=A0A0F9SX98_9ZZZZ
MVNKDEIIILGVPEGPNYFYDLYMATIGTCTKGREARKALGGLTKIHTTYTSSGETVSEALRALAGNDNIVKCFTCGTEYIKGAACTLCYGRRQDYLEIQQYTKLLRGR